MAIAIMRSAENEAAVLSDLSVRSKSHWNYSNEQLAGWRPQMVITPEYIAAHEVWTIWNDGHIVGFYALKRGREDVLDHFWLEPALIGKGFGRCAFTHVVNRAKDIGLRNFFVVSDPNAEGFYLKMGAVRIGAVTSMPQNRLLPKLRFDLPKEDRELFNMPVTEADFEELLALRIAAMRESLERVGRFDPERARARLQSTFEPRHTWFIATDGGNVGFYACTPIDGGLSLDHLYIHPDFQSRGYGSIVLKRITAEADSLGWVIKLGALKQSGSNRFYQRHGFRQVSESEWDNYYVREPKTRIMGG